MVEWEGQVDDVILVGSAQLVEALALQDLQVADLCSLGEPWGRRVKCECLVHLSLGPPEAELKLFQSLGS